VKRPGRSEFESEGLVFAEQRSTVSVYAGTGPHRRGHEVLGLYGKRPHPILISWGLHSHLMRSHSHLMGSPTTPFYLSCLPATSTRLYRRRSYSGSRFRSVPSANRRCCSGRISHLDKFSECSNRVRAIGINRWLNGHRKGFEQFALVIV
jgi:hypothetical protein